MREFYHSVFIRVNTGQWKPIFSHNYAMNTQILAYASNNIKKNRLCAVHATHWDQGVRRNNFVQNSSQNELSEELSLSKIINFYPPWNHQKTVGFLMISGGIKNNLFASIRLILEKKFGDVPKSCNFTVT